MQAHPNARWLFLTLTVRNCPVSELKATLGQMNKAWNKLVQRKQFPALGFVRSTEVTRAENGDAHPHFHCLLIVKPSYFSGQNYVTQAQWAELWQKSLRVDYLPIVDVRSVKPRHAKTNSISVALLETLKYTVKPDDLLHDAPWLQELTKQLHKTRAVSVGGLLRDYIDDKEPDDLIHVDEDAASESDGEVKVFFGWREMVSRYLKE
jgi:plasmid rolling circle replication initiator protein Rep